MTECGDTRIQSESIFQDLLDMIGLDVVEVFIDSSFGDNDDCLAFPDFSMLLNGRTHLVFP